MNNTVSKGLKVFFLTLTVSLISFFVVVSFNMLKVGFFTDDIGYEVKTQNGDKLEELYKYYIVDNTDVDAEKYEKEGYKLSKEVITAETGEGDKAETIEIGFEVYGVKDGKTEKELLYKYYNEEGHEILSKEYEEKKVELHSYSFRSEIEKGPDIALSVLSQICCLFIVVAFIYNELWKIGNKDFENVRLHGHVINKLKGLYIGLIGIMPMVILLTFCLITKNSVMSDSPIAIFTFANCYAFESIFAITNGITYWVDVNLLQAIGYYAILLIVPLISMVSYIIGVKDISLAEKLIYKNNKDKRRR